VILNKISLLNFKNYDQIEVKVSPFVNCFLGKNGMGKTNLLDGIYYLSNCKSFFNSVDSQNIKNDTVELKEGRKKFSKKGRKNTRNYLNTLD
jgi:DNA replication and repair protein RecF